METGPLLQRQQETVAPVGNLDNELDVRDKRDIIEFCEFTPGK